jgi:aerobic-type carbon monoxide dehydrogenase small subunit (CoxS/CutS family)
MKRAWMLQDTAFSVYCNIAVGTVVSFLQMMMQPQLLTCIQELTGSNLGRDTEYPEISRGFPQSPGKISILWRAA